jgi:SAM-dependent methyltransferase
VTDFPPGFFDRQDDRPDFAFYAPDRFVTHIDDRAIAAVGRLYAELGVSGRVLDLMSSWVSHFREAPEHLTVLGMNANEARANPSAADRVVHDLNVDPVLPFADGSFDDVVCCVSVDYLRPGGRLVVTFSNRCFPTKAIMGWLANDDAGHCRIVEAYFEASGAFEPATVDVRLAPGTGGDPLYAVWAARR